MFQMQQMSSKVFEKESIVCASPRVSTFNRNRGYEVPADPIAESVTEGRPGTDEGSQPISKSLDALMARAKPKLLSAAEDARRRMMRHHPGPIVKTEDIPDRDLQWHGIGSGIVARSFKQATKLMTTSRGGPPMCDVQSRVVRSLNMQSTG